MVEKIQNHPRIPLSELFKMSTMMVHLSLVVAAVAMIASTAVHSAISPPLYRVILVVSELGWVDLDLRCSTILLGQ